jgi:hypothetical protein
VAYRDFAWDGIEQRRFPLYVPLVKRYIDERFEVLEKTGSWVILQRRL